MNTELIVPSKETALSVYQTEGGLDPFLKHIREEINSFVPDISTKKGREAIASMAYKVAKSKTALDDIGKELVADLKEIPKKIDAERKRVREILDQWKDEVRKPLTEWEMNEEKRMADHKSAIESIRSALNDVDSIDSTEIKGRISRIEIITVGDSFEEYEIEAARTKESVLLKLKTSLSRRIQHENEQAELAKLRAEAAAREQKDREERIAKEAEDRALKAAEEKARADREAGEKRELELKLQAEKAEREKLEAQQREENAKKEAVVREDRLKVEAEERQKKAIEDERKRQAEAEAKIEADRIKREQNVNHMRKINNEAMTAFKDNGMTKDCAKMAVSLIAKKLIPHITIEY